jgi:RNA exonuclease 4
VSLVDYQGQAILDSFVAPTMPITDYRYSATGIEPAQLDPRMFFLTLFYFIFFHSKKQKSHPHSKSSKCTWPTCSKTKSLLDIASGKIYQVPLFSSVYIYKFGLTHTVLGIPHPAVATRDVALYMPFRNALRSPNQVIGLQTLMWHLMCRRIQDDELNPLENARAALDLYRSADDEWETAVAKGHWPSHLPPSTFSRCYL